jgi:DNA polymerase I
MKKLILIDGNAILFRAYHALPALTSSDGTVINAVYGFFSMLFKIMEEQKPDYLVVCFDHPKPTFRQTLYADYHANRPRAADELVIQMKLVRELVTRMKIKLFEVEGYEADDLIGTLAKQAVSGQLNGALEVIIVTGDRDLLQLVNPHVKVLMPIVGITKMLLMGEQDVTEKYGVRPQQFVDYKALIGDPSDNYPGVAGIGSKTAANLLKEHESFEQLYENLALVPTKIAQRLAADAEQAALAKKLAAILTDAPITLRLEEAQVSDFQPQEGQKAFAELGIKSLQKRIPGFSGTIETAPVRRLRQEESHVDLL